jgi:Fe-S oxidoreductase
MDEPRRVLASTGAKAQEMRRRKKDAFCCGAGGSHAWMEESRGQRINQARTEEAVETGANIIAVACPFCMQMFEDGVGAVPQAAEKEIQVLDLAELLDMSVSYSKPTPTATPPADEPPPTDGESATQGGE